MGISDLSCRLRASKNCCWMLWRFNYRLRNDSLLYYCRNRNMQILFAVTEVCKFFLWFRLFSGFFSGRMYRTMNGDQWKKAAIVVNLNISWFFVCYSEIFCAEVSRRGMHSDEFLYWTIPYSGMCACLILQYLFIRIFNLWVFVCGLFIYILRCFICDI